MSLTVYIDRHGRSFVDFPTLRNELQERDEPLTAEHLTEISYPQLILCATAPAGKNSQVTIDDVRAEKNLRWSRFLSMSDEEFQGASRYLRAEGMYDDLVLARGLSSAPKWEDLTPRQKLWAKFDCLYNHVDQPQERIGHLDRLLEKAAISGDIPPQVAKDFRVRILDILRRSKSLPTEKLRNKVGALTMELSEYLSDSESSLCTEKAIADFECTADCFRVFTGGSHV